MEASRALIERLAAGRRSDLCSQHRGRAAGECPHSARGSRPAAAERDPVALLRESAIRCRARVVRAMMLIRANVLAKGLLGHPAAGGRAAVRAAESRRDAAWCRRRAAWARRGDLAPLAHMALVLIGEGEAEYEGAVLPGGEALRRAGIEPIDLHPKEGISLINGTQAMLAIGCLELAGGGDPGGIGRRDLRDDAGRAARHAAGVRRADSRRRGRIPGQMESAARLRASAGRQRDPPVAHRPAGGCRTPIRCAACRRCTGRCGTRWPRRGGCSRSS